MSCSSNGQTAQDSGNLSPVHGIHSLKNLNRRLSVKSLKRPGLLLSIQSLTPPLPNGRSQGATSPTGKLNTTLRYSLSGATVLPLASPPTPSMSSGFRFRSGSMLCWNPRNTSMPSGCLGKKLPRNAFPGQTGKPSNSCLDISSRIESLPILSACPGTGFSAGTGAGGNCLPALSGHSPLCQKAA